MKELIEKYIASRKKFNDEKWAVEDAFGEFLESIPGWRDLMASILVVNGYNIPDDLDFDCLGDILIPEVMDIDYCGERISFKIRIPGETWVKKYIDVSWFPFEWLTNPETKPLDPVYLRSKLMRREEWLKSLLEDENKIQTQVSEVREEINRIKKLLKED